MRPRAADDETATQPNLIKRGLTKEAKKERYSRLFLFLLLEQWSFGGGTRDRGEGAVGPSC